MCIEEGEKVQAKGIGDIFNEMIAENFPNIKKPDDHPGTGNL
jgi:hypothetical protein